MRRGLLAIAGLSLLLFALDQLYRVLHPEVNLVRASLVGLTALLALALLAKLPRFPRLCGGPPSLACGSLRGRFAALRPWVGALAIFASAFLSVLLIQAGLLVSRSPGSGLVHLLILAGAYPLLDRVRARRVASPEIFSRAR
jgi:hypothetical protein